MEFVWWKQERHTEFWLEYQAARSHERPTTTTGWEDDIQINVKWALKVHSGLK
jgi:hypothetical protein